jgi:hypothetical protein
MSLINDKTDDKILECIKYLHENGCPWSEKTCDWAAKSGHLECLKYLHENGCPLAVETCANAPLLPNYLLK